MQKKKKKASNMLFAQSRDLQNENKNIFYYIKL